MTEVNSIRPFSAFSFEQYLAEHKLMVTRCAKCASNYIPPRAICPQCHSDQMEWVEASGDARLAAFTVIYGGPTFMAAQGFDRKNPYISGIVALEEGPSISARITGIDPLKPEMIQIGTLLSVDFIEYGQGELQRTALAFKAV